MKISHFSTARKASFPSVGDTTIITENDETPEKLRDITYNSNSPSLALPRVRL